MGQTGAMPRTPKGAARSQHPLLPRPRVPLSPPAPSHLALRKASLLLTLSTQTGSPLTLPLCSTAFVSKQEGSEVVKRLRRYLDPGLG